MKPSPLSLLTGILLLTLAACDTTSKEISQLPEARPMGILEASQLQGNLLAQALLIEAVLQ